MLKILIPVDGSDNALRAVRHAVFLARCNTEIECYLLNVQEPIVGRIRAYRSQEEIEQLEIEEAEQALRPAREILDTAGIPYSATCVVGEISQAITDYAETAGCNAIFMGMRGMGLVVGPLIMGSVTCKVVHTTKVPVTLVK